MKKLIKNNIYGFILGAILFGGLGIVVATTILSSSVSYTNNNQTTVDVALDKLYTIRKRFADKYSINSNGIGGKISFVYWNDNFDYTNNYTYSEVPTGSGLNGTYATKEALKSAYNGWNDTPVYVKTTKVDSTITGHSACLWFNNHEFCLLPNYWDTDGITTKTKLKTDMENALGIIIDDSDCVYDNTGARCNAGDFRCYVASTGDVSCHSYVNEKYCHVSTNGTVRCHDL